MRLRPVFESLLKDCEGRGITIGTSVSTTSHNLAEVEGSHIVEIDNKKGSFCPWVRKRPSVSFRGSSSSSLSSTSLWGSLTSKSKRTLSTIPLFLKKQHNFAFCCIRGNNNKEECPSIGKNLARIRLWWWMQTRAKIVSYRWLVWHWDDAKSTDQWSLAITEGMPSRFFCEFEIRIQIRKCPGSHHQENIDFTYWDLSMLIAA